MDAQEAWTNAMDWLARAQERLRSGQPALAEDVLLLALPLLGTVGEELTEGNAWLLLGQVRLERANLAGAVDALQQAIGCFEQGEHVTARARASLALAEALVRQGKPASALPLLLEAIDRLRISGSTLHEALARCALAEAQLALGDRTGARAALTRVVQQTQTLNAPGTEARARALLSRLALAEGAYGEAVYQVGEAIAASESVSDAVGVAWGLQLRAEILRRGGRAWEAFWTARRASRIFHREGCEQGLKAVADLRRGWTFWGVVWLELTRRLGLGRGQLRSGA